MDFLKEIIISTLVFLTGLFGLGVAIDTEDSSVSIEPEAVTLVRVIDGDTIVVSIEGKEERVRYIGIDTPELARNSNEAECFAEEAKMRNQALLSGGEVALVADTENRDKYQRLLRYVYVDNLSVNETLVSEGYATALYIAPNISNHRNFKEKENEAKLYKRGLWGSCKS